MKDIDKDIKSFLESDFECKFWTCPNHCKSFIKWKKLDGKLYAECSKCGSKEKVES